GRLQQLVQDEVLVKDMEDAVRRGYDAAVTAPAVLAAASNDRQGIHAPLALAHELFEGPASARSQRCWPSPAGVPTSTCAATTRERSCSKRLSSHALLRCWTDSTSPYATPKPMRTT